MGKYFTGKQSVFDPETKPLSVSYKKILTWTWAADKISHLTSKIQNMRTTVSLWYAGGCSVCLLSPLFPHVDFLHPLYHSTAWFLSRSLTLIHVLQWGAYDGSSGEEVCEVRDGAGQVGGLQPHVVSLRQLHVLPLPRAHHRLQPLLPARPLSWRSLPPLPQVLLVDRPHGALSHTTAALILLKYTEFFRHDLCVCAFFLKINRNNFWLFCDFATLTLTLTIWVHGRPQWPGRSITGNPKQQLDPEQLISWSCSSSAGQELVWTAVPRNGQILITRGAH